MFGSSRLCRSGDPWAVSLIRDSLFVVVILSWATFSMAVIIEQEGSAPIHSMPPLDLDPFEDDDCLEVPHAEVLLQLMHAMCELLEQVLWSQEDAEEGSEPIFTVRGQGEAWSAFDVWSEENFASMINLAVPVLGRPYCEPGKVAWLAAECILLLRQGGKVGEKEALNCAAALDEDILAKMTPREERYNTRVHLVLRSPWPAFRLLDLLVRLHPERGTTRMGACRGFQKWNSDPDIFDWPWFKPVVLRAADMVTSDAELLKLRPEDGPLSRQYRARWLRVHGTRYLRQAISFSDDVFENYREHHYQAGCHLGVVSSYILQMLLVHLRDVEGRLQRYSASVAQLINLHAPFSYIVQSDWPVYRLMHLMSLLQRAPAQDVWSGGRSELRASRDPAKVLCRNVEDAVKDLPYIAYVTAAWGHLAPFAESVLRRWAGLFGGHDDQHKAPLLLLAIDSEASQKCSAARDQHLDEKAADSTFRSVTRCIEAPRRLGIEGTIAKYLTLATITRLGITAVWLDLDIFVLQDPTPHIHVALSGGGDVGTRKGVKEVVFAKYMMSDSINPAIVAARGSVSASELLLKYACWLRENPFLLDHQGWDQFLNNEVGEHAGGFDYQGRNVTLKDDIGPKLSFLPKDGNAPPGTKWGRLGSEFGAGDGWIGSTTEDLVFFHFWGADESQSTLFNLLYPHGHAGVPSATIPMLERYRRHPFSAPRLSALLGQGGSSHGGGGRTLHLVSLSYAHGCCERSLQKNRLQALKVGVDDARAYGVKDLSPAWTKKHHEILSQRRGAGWWLWKPYLILRALKDPAVPWARGVVMWVDAGNYLFADPRSLVESALWHSDVAALRLKTCLEADWTSSRSLQQLNVSRRYAVTDRPQLGAYFLLFRKTQIAISFVEDWLRRSEDPIALIGGVDSDGMGDEVSEIPGFQKHQADQSVFSVLFKDYGFSAISLEEGHKILKLARWRM